MSGTYDTLQTQLVDSMNALFKIKNQIYNTVFDKSQYFLSYPFDKDNINGIFLYKVAVFYYEKLKTYPFCGDMQFARMFILGEVFGDIQAKKASKMFYIFNLLLKNVVKTKEGFKLQIGEQSYEGDINELCVYFYKQGTFDIKYNNFVQMVINISTGMNEYSLPVQDITQYSQAQQSAQYNFVQLQMLQDQKNISIQSCINKIDLDIYNSTVGNITIEQVCTLVSKK